MEVTQFPEKVTCIDSDKAPKVGSQPEELGNRGFPTGFSSEKSTVERVLDQKKPLYNLDVPGRKLGFFMVRINNQWVISPILINGVYYWGYNYPLILASWV